MTDETISISRVALARNLPRILAIPAFVALVGIAAVGGGLLLGGGIRIPLIVGGVATILFAAMVARVPLTMRLEVEVGGIRLRWLGGERHYRLVPGPVTRATVAGAGAGAGALRIRFGFLGWAVGPGVLRGTERVSVVRLAPTRTVILVPIEGGRVALAAASEGGLLAALGAAARVQQRLDEVSGRLRAAAPVAAAARQPVEQPAEAFVTGRILTGIERAWLEAQLTAAREAALAAAEAERAAIAEGRISVVAVPGALRPTVTEAQRWRAPNAARRRSKATWTRPAWATPVMVAVLVAWGWALVPLLASGVAWLVTAPATASVAGTSPRILALALSLGGPAAAVGVLATRAWWPRMTGLVAITAVGALMMVARAAAG